MKIEALRIDDEIVEVRMRPEHVHVFTPRSAIVIDVNHETMLDSALHAVTTSGGRCSAYYSWDRLALISPAELKRRAGFLLERSHDGLHQCA